MIAEAARRFPVRVIEITAPPDVLAARLADTRARAAADIAARLARSVRLPDGISVETVVNDATIEHGVARFLAALSRAAAAVPRAGTGAPASAWVNRQMSVTRRGTRAHGAK